MIYKKSKKREHKMKKSNKVLPVKETKAEEKLDVKQGLKEGSKADLKKDMPKPFKKY